MFNSVEQALGASIATSNHDNIGDHFASQHDLFLPMDEICNAVDCRFLGVSLFCLGVVLLIVRYIPPQLQSSPGVIRFPTIGLQDYSIA